MNGRARRHITSDAILLWFACIVAAGAGFSLAFGVLGRTIDAQELRTQEIAARLSADARILAARPALEAQRDALSASLRDLRLQTDRSTTVARFIRIAAQVAALHRVTLRRIDERSGAAPPDASSAATPVTAAAPQIQSLPLDVTLCGGYADLIAVIRDLARAPVTMRIAVAALERTAPGSTTEAPALTARLHVVLLRWPDTHLIGVSPYPTVEDPATHARSL